MSPKAAASRSTVVSTSPKWERSGQMTRFSRMSGRTGIVFTHLAASDRSKSSARKLHIEG
ncbi:Uncharacterized protein pbN1_08010 [Aromatoleum bremense]|nr:Uncharacterized protein pbN1_08010 [Aromatoleum bremense]